MSSSASTSAPAVNSAAAPSSSASTPQRGPFQLFQTDNRGCHHVDYVEYYEYATESEFRAQLSGTMKQIQADFQSGYIEQDPANAHAPPSEEEVAAVVTGEMSIDDAVRKIHAWHELNSCGIAWRAVKEIVQPTSNNSRATIRDVGGYQQ